MTQFGIEVGDEVETKPRLGMLLPSGNVVAEAQMLTMLSSDILLYVTRLKLTSSSNEALDGMTRALPEAADLLADARVNLIAFNCTAVSTRQPDADRRIATEIEEVTGIPAITTAQGIVAGLNALGAKRIVLVTPYLDPVVEKEAAFLRHHGFEILSSMGTGIDTNWDMAKVPASVWEQTVIDAEHPEADAYLLSCTAIHTLSLIRPLEERLNVPVLTSNQALAWICLRRLGVTGAQKQLGRLGRCQELQQLA